MLEFGYHRPADLEEATAALADLGEEACVMAGGTALLLGLRQRLIQPEHVISLGRVEELRGIRKDDDGWLRLGALSLHSEVAESQLVRSRYPMLASLASRMANPQVRNQGTLGGNLCYGDPSTDPPGALLALGAHVVLRSATGERRLPMEEFLVDYFATALKPGELLVEVKLPPADGWQGRYRRFLRTAADHRPLVSISVYARGRAGACSDIRIVVAGSTPVPMRARQAEGLLCAGVHTARAIAEAVESIAEEVDVLDDARASAGYRRQIIKVVARQTIEELFAVATPAEVGEPS